MGVYPLESSASKTAADAAAAADALQRPSKQSQGMRDITQLRNWHSMRRADAEQFNWTAPQDNKIQFVSL